MQKWLGLILKGSRQLAIHPLHPKVQGLLATDHETRRYFLRIHDVITDIGRKGIQRAPDQSPVSSDTDGGLRRKGASSGPSISQEGILLDIVSVESVLLDALCLLRPEISRL